MAWIYLKDSSDSTSSAALAELVMPSKDSSPPSPTAKLIPTAKASSCKECKQGICPRHQFGTTFARYHLKNCPQLTSSTVDSHARILALQDAEKAWQESKADYFSRLCAWQKRYAQIGSSWKMSPPLRIEEASKYLKSLPRHLMMCGGVLYPLRPSGHCIGEKESSYLPTPKARDHMDSGVSPSDRRRNSPSLPCVVKTLYPTPTTSGMTPRSEIKKNQHTHLATVVMLNPEMIGKKLCAKWVNVLMGYPPNWTSIRNN